MTNRITGYLSPLPPPDPAKRLPRIWKRLTQMQGGRMPKADLQRLLRDMKDLVPQHRHSMRFDFSAMAPVVRDAREMRGWIHAAQTYVASRLLESSQLKEPNDHRSGVLFENAIKSADVSLLYSKLLFYLVGTWQAWATGHSEGKRIPLLSIHRNHRLTLLEIEGILLGQRSTMFAYGKRGKHLWKAVDRIHSRFYFTAQMLAKDILAGYPYLWEPETLFNFRFFHMAEILVDPFAPVVFRAEGESERFVARARASLFGSFSGFQQELRLQAARRRKWEKRQGHVRQDWFGLYERLPVRMLVTLAELIRKRHPAVADLAPYEIRFLHGPWVRSLSGKYPRNLCFLADCFDERLAVTCDFSPTQMNLLDAHTRYLWRDDPWVTDMGGILETVGFCRLGEALDVWHLRREFHTSLEDVLAPLRTLPEHQREDLAKRFVLVSRNESNERRIRHVLGL